MFEIFKDYSKCTDCEYCLRAIDCAPKLLADIDNRKYDCIGCGACAAGCPVEALSVQVREQPATKLIEIKINGESYQVPSKITIERALEFAGFKLGRHELDGDADIRVYCDTGGCWSCTVFADGSPVRACITEVLDGMEIELVSITEPEKDKGPEPVRLVHGFQAHTVGGVGTPWEIKRSGERFIEAVCFTPGCNFRCPQCQNWRTTYLSVGTPMTPDEAAEKIMAVAQEYRVNRLAISGGEPTLNRPWLVKYFKKLTELGLSLNDMRLHLDTNGSILSESYLDELVSAGMTDIGIDLKGSKLSTFIRITGVKDKTLAEKYLTTAWNAVKYLVDNYNEKVFVGIGVPYNRRLISLGEIAEIGDRLNRIDSYLQVCVLDYRPEFRQAKSLRTPTSAEMKRVQTILESTGLRNVICQTPEGYLPPKTSR